MRGVKAVACIGALAMLTVACGGSSGQKVTIEATPAALKRAAQATLDKKTAKVDVTMGLQIQGHPITMRGAGAFDQPNKRVQLEFDMKDFANLASGSAESSLAEAFAQPLTVVLDGTVMYMHFPLLAKIAGSGKEWMKIDLGKANSNFSDLLGSGGTGAFGSDPTAFVQFLEGAGKVSKVGTEDVRGVSTTHFSGSYTLKDALESLPEDRRQKVQDLYSGLGIPDSASDTEIPFDAWIDNDALLRKMETTIDFSQFAGAKIPVGKTSMTMELYDFGAPVDITIPSEDEVFDATSLASSASSKFSSVGSSIN